MERSNMLQHRMYLNWTISTHQVVGIFSSKSWHLHFHPPATYHVIDVSDSPTHGLVCVNSFLNSFLCTHVDQFFSSTGFTTAFHTCWSIFLFNRFLNSFQFFFPTGFSTALQTCRSIFLILLSLSSSRLLVRVLLSCIVTRIDGKEKKGTHLEDTIPVWSLTKLSSRGTGTCPPGSSVTNLRDRS